MNGPPGRGLRNTSIGDSRGLFITDKMSATDAEYRKPCYRVLLGEPVPVYYAVADGIFVGNLWSADSVPTLDHLDIMKVINLTNFDIEPVDGVEYVEFGLPDTEMLDAEIPRMEGKLDHMVKVINQTLAAGQRVLICCEDGRNKSMMTAAYYLCNHGSPLVSTIKRLETAYFTPAQKASEELELRDGRHQPDRNDRQKVRSLTMKSYITLLRRKFDTTAPNSRYIYGARGTM